MAITFLIVDDDQDDREMFCEAVEAVDKQIVCIMEASGRKAMDKLRSKQAVMPDVIFLDINMPVMDGWQCLSLLKSHDVLKSLPVILYSTSSFHEDIQKAEEMGATSFLTKPSDFRVLIKFLGIVVNHVSAGSLRALPPGSMLF